MKQKSKENEIIVALMRLKGLIFDKMWVQKCTNVRFYTHFVYFRTTVWTICYTFAPRNPMGSLSLLRMVEKTYFRIVAMQSKWTFRSQKDKK